MQGLAFRGNDELENSLNQGNFLELLKVLASCNEEINNVMLKNAPNNLKLTSPHIQTDIINSATTEITKAIITYLRDDLFSILVDECRDVSIKEQMGVVIWYVNGFGCVIERFISLVHIQNTSATSLKKGIESLLSTYGLNISSLRGQGYDGATNMRGEFNGLKSLILKDNSSAYYIYCFTHQLQLTLFVAKKHSSISSFFNTVTHLVNVIGGSLFEEIAKCEIKTEQGLNQEMALKRSGDTRWSSHYGTVVNLMHLFPSVIDVLEYIGENGILQMRAQDIVNTMNLVRVSKCHLQVIRENGWDSLLPEVLEFCDKYEIVVLDIEDVYVARGRSRHKSKQLANIHHYRVKLFYSVIDMQF
ncbi:hypothetical protein P3X46_010483 [Hevea brasiliensis]|uniref:DUF4371 domain-containing protein n=1 Tax=Hevea brasiliensis TaxID=3981 RepID=A0ABQ9MI99_HEVBR|nr:hypothetical protein P3X46_010483 [Hevea brasiliensis]